MPAELNVDVAIVGAGPAGLFAAWKIGSSLNGATVVLIDKGPDLDSRINAHESGRRSEDWLTGFGGAGFFIGGRMSFDPDTRTGRPSNVLPELSAQLAHDVDQILDMLGARSPIQIQPPSLLAKKADEAAALGLTWLLNYPARHLTGEDRLTCLTALRSGLVRRGVSILTETEVYRVSRCDDTWRLSTEGTEPRTIKCRRVLLAPGRGQAQWLDTTMASLGVQGTPERSVGVRVEAVSEVLAPLTNLTPDPRLFLVSPGGEFRTYAFVVGGFVSVGESDIGPRITCRPGGNERTSNTSFSILWESNSNGQATLEVLPPPGVERLAGLRLAMPTQALTASAPDPSLRVPSRDVSDDWAGEFWSGFANFVSWLDRLAPGVGDGKNLIYSPAIETSWKYPLDNSGLAGHSGIYLAGDGAGVTQGAMAAAISGLAAAHGIMDSLA